MNERIEAAIAELAAAVNEFQRDVDPQSREVTLLAIRAFIYGQLEGWFTTMTPTPPPELDAEQLRRFRRKP